MSRRVFSFLAVLSVAWCVILLPSASAGEVSHARIVRLSYTVGDVQSGSIVGEGGSEGLQKAVANVPIREGMVLSTHEGLAEVEFESGATAWIASNTTLEIPELALEDGAKLTQLGVKQGTATFYVEPGKHDTFAVEAGPFRITAPDTARFRVDVFSDGAAVSVLRGPVQVTENGETERVGSHITLKQRSDSTEGVKQSATPKPDVWDRWVADRNSALEAGRLNTTDSINAPFGYGMADLSFYGGWTTIPGYGFAWQPYGVGSGWSPFFNGYWDAFGAFGPTWVSSEPWGWLPYHYGGWVYSPAQGWAWSPSGFGPWSPGSVLWARTPAGIGWVAQAPGGNANGTAANLKFGLVTNTSAGIVAGSANGILRGKEAANAQMMGEWKGNAELGRLTQQAEARAQVRAVASASASEGAGSSPRVALRMPEGAAPRIPTAGRISGRAQVYSPPSPPRGGMLSSGGGAVRLGGAAGSPSAAQGSQRGGAPASHAAATGGASGGGGREKP